MEDPLVELCGIRVRNRLSITCHLISTSTHLLVSFSPIFSLSYSLFRSLGFTLPGNGCGGSHRVYRMLGKVRWTQVLEAVAKYTRRDYHGFPDDTLHEPGQY